MNTILTYALLICFNQFSISNIATTNPEYIRSQVHNLYNVAPPAGEYPSVQPPMNRLPNRDDILGERFIAGDTWYDYQTNGSLGKMIAVDPNGGVHITWMDGLDDDLIEGVRRQKFNYYNPNGQWVFEDGNNADNADRSGYGCLCLTTEDDPRALVFYHGRWDDDWRGLSSIDFFQGWGAFTQVLLPRFPDQIIYFPQGVMSVGGRIHVAFQRRDRQMISYAYGWINEDNGLPEYWDIPRQVGETHRTTLRIAQSPINERVAIVWLRSRVGVPAPENWGTTKAYAMNNDLMLAWSDDGENWDFDNPVDITQNNPPDPHLEGEYAYGDTLRPYANFDVTFDSDNNIHVVFDARGFWEQPVPEDEPPVDGITIDASYLFHWDEVTEEITPVADGWFAHKEVDDDGEIIRWPTPSGWLSNVCAPSLAYAENGDLYCVFNYYPLEDYSVEEYCNGEICATVSTDNGATWYLPTRITETRTHLAEVGESESEVFPTLADVVDDYLHISYEIDTEPGSVINDLEDRAEVATLCSWIYHRVPVEDIQREELWEDGPSWHVEPVRVPDESHIDAPQAFTLGPVYPNPFNAAADIGFSLTRSSDVNLTVYDLSGQALAVLHEGFTEAGHHRASWNASEMPTGIYFCRMEAGGLSESVKLVVVR